MSGARRGPAPHVVAAMASSLVLGVGSAVTAYFVAVRGAGLAVELGGPRGVEIAMLGAALLVVTVVTQFAVAQAVKQSRGGGNGTRKLVRRALALDSTDPEALREFEVVPELRDLVGMLVAEKGQVHELGDRVEALRGELAGLAEGMRRSVQDLGRMREEGHSELGFAIASAWNGLIDRVQRSQSTAEAAPAPAPPAAPVAALVARLDELEAELGRLRGALAASRPAPRTAAESGTAAVAVPSDRGTADPPTWEVLTEAAPGTGAPRWNVPIPAAAGTAPARDLFGIDETDMLERVTARPARDAAPAAVSAASTADAPSFDDIDFPHFVGRPPRPVADRVEVTYEAQDGEEVVELPASALLFESDETGSEPSVTETVLDLRSLGALEFER